LCDEFLQFFGNLIVRQFLLFSRIVRKGDKVEQLLSRQLNLVAEEFALHRNHGLGTAPYPGGKFIGVHGLGQLANSLDYLAANDNIISAGPA
jgi:hypothetical protein